MGSKSKKKKKNSKNKNSKNISQPKENTNQKEKKISGAIILLFIVPIVDSCCLMFGLFESFDWISLIDFLLRVVSMLLATCVSITASLAFYNNFKDKEDIFNNRVIVAILSLCFHFILEYNVIRKEADIIYKCISLLISLVFCIWMMSLTISAFKTIEDYRKSIEKDLDDAKMNNKEMKEIDEMTVANADNNQYNVEGQK